MKKTILTAIATALAITAAAQATKTYTVSGKALSGINKVYILDAAKRFAAIDSASVSTDGTFTATGNHDRDAVLALGIGDDAIPFINDGTPIAINFSDNTIQASTQNSRLYAYDRELTPLEKQMQDIVKTARALKDPSQATIDSIGAAYSAIADKVEARQTEIVMQNKDNMIPVVYLPDLVYSLSYEQLQELCSQDRPYYHHPAIAQPRRMLEGMAKRQPGLMFTDMEIPATDGTKHKLSEWIGKGQYVMVDFWASWCGPCRQEMPNVVENYKKYHSKGFEIIGISFDQNAAPWKNAIEQMGMTWPQLSDLGGWKSAAAGVYGIMSIPASILFDPEGKIVATDLRAEKLGAKLAELYDK